MIHHVLTVIKEAKELLEIVYLNVLLVFIMMHHQEILEDYVHYIVIIHFQIMKKEDKINHKKLIVNIVIYQVIFSVSLMWMVVDVLHHVNLDFIEVEEVLDIVNLYVILVIFLIPLLDILIELVLQHV